MDVGIKYKPTPEESCSLLWLKWHEKEQVVGGNGIIKSETWVPLLRFGDVHLKISMCDLLHLFPRQVIGFAITLSWTFTGVLSDLCWMYFGGYFCGVDSTPTVKITSGNPIGLPLKYKILIKARTAPVLGHGRDRDVIALLF